MEGQAWDKQFNLFCYKRGYGRHTGGTDSQQFWSTAGQTLEFFWLVLKAWESFSVALGSTLCTLTFVLLAYLLFYERQKVFASEQLVLSASVLPVKRWGPIASFHFACPGSVPFSSRWKCFCWCSFFKQFVGFLWISLEPTSLDKLSCGFKATVTYLFEICSSLLWTPAEKD